MEIIELLTADHRTVEQLLEQIEEAEGDDRMPLIQELERSLGAHMQLEEEHLYSIVKQELGDDEYREADIEHRLAREGLEKLKALAPDGPGFGAVLDMVKAGITHHVEDEEGELFPQLQSEAGDRLEEAQPRILAERERMGLPMSVVSGPGAASLTRDELYEKAKAAGIEGRSDMTKDELVAALQNRQ